MRGQATRRDAAQRSAIAQPGGGRREGEEPAHDRRGARREERRAVALAEVLDAVERGRQHRRLADEARAREEAVEDALDLFGVDGERLAVAREELEEGVHAHQARRVAQAARAQQVAQVGVEVEEQLHVDVVRELGDAAEDGGEEGRVGATLDDAGGGDEDVLEDAALHPREVAALAAAAASCA